MTGDFRCQIDHATGRGRTLLGSGWWSTRSPTWRSLRPGRRMLYGIRTSFTVCIRTCFTHSGGEVTFHGGGRYESDRSAGTEASPLQRHAWPLQGRYSVSGRFMGAISFARATITIGDHLRESASSAVDGRGQQSRSAIANLEIFTQRATHASPLHRYAPDKTGAACRWRSMGAVPSGDMRKGNSLV